MADLYVISLAVAESILRSLVRTPTFLPARLHTSLYILYFIILLSLDNDVLETSKHCAMFYNILSQNFIVELFISVHH